MDGANATSDTNLPTVAFSYITTPHDRDAAIAALGRASILAVDTEGDSLYRYRESVSLIQCSANGENYIFDPVMVDVFPLVSLFQNKSILKIFHGASYDITSLKRDFKFIIHSIFDTEIASRAIGGLPTSLQSLIARYFHVMLSKVYQKSDWSRRPLRPEQLAYAAQDTHYLIRLYEILRDEAQIKGRMDIVEEECRLLEDVVWNGKAFEPDDYLKIKGASTLSQDDQRVLRRLVVLRDELAREKDCPPFKIMGNTDLLLLACEQPKSEAALRLLFPRLTAMIHRNPTRWIEALCADPQGEAALPEKVRSGPEALTRRQERLFIHIKEWRDRQSLDEGVDPAMVISASLLKEIARHEPKTVEAVHQIPKLRTWQKQRYAQAIVSQIVKFATSSPKLPTAA